MTSTNRPPAFEGLRLPAFSAAEMERRRSRVTELSPEVDVSLFHTADSVLYLSGVPLLSEWGRPMWCLLRPDGTGASIGAEIELENMEENSAFDQVRAYGDDENVWASSIGWPRS